MPTDYPGNGDRLSQIDHDHVWHPFTSLGESFPPVLITSAEGIYLSSHDGKKIMDAVSSWWVNIHGHANQTIANAIYQQASKLEHVIFAGFTHEPAITLTKNLLSILPANQNRLFFSDNGSTAVEVALKMAMQYWFNQNIPRQKIIALEGAYHGDTFGSMSVGSRGPFTKPFQPYLFEVAFVDVPTTQNFDTVLKNFSALIDTREIAAFIYEPLVQGAAGMVMYQGEFLMKLMEVARDAGVICIADEVFTGFGRTGKLFASDHIAMHPDIIAVSKGITGGTLPLGVTSCSRQIEEAFRSTKVEHTFFHGHSYTANPVSCAAANASFELLMREECMNSIERISRQQKQFATKIDAHEMVSEARSCGTILAIQILTGENTSYFNNLRNTIYHYFLERNILLRPLGNIIYVLPPYIITETELDHIHAVIHDFLDYLKQEVQ